MALQGHPRTILWHRSKARMRHPIGHQFNSNLGPVLSRFRDIAVFFSVENIDAHLYSTRILGCSLGLHWRCFGSKVRRPKLIIRVINFELVHATYTPTVQQCYGQTDRRTEHKGTTYNSNTALCTTCIAW